MQFQIMAGIMTSLVALSARAAGNDIATDDVHSEAQNIVVTAPYGQVRADLLSSVSVLSGEALSIAAKGQIGDTISRQPGVSSTSFGPGAARPVLRGFSGERIRVLTDGIGSIDLSNLSADHAVAIDPLTAARVEILRGPGTLMYGSSAIGGLVNVIDKRIPRVIPHDDVHFDVVGGFSTAANDYNAGASADVAIGERIAVHVDGSYHDSGDLETGGFILAPAVRAMAADFGNPLADQKGKLPNSSVRTYTAGSGFAFIDDGGELGASLGYYNSEYGIPIRPALATDQEEEAASIKLRQYRFDVRGAVELPGFFERLRLRVGAADYEHSEIIEGEIETTFKSKGLEGRFELIQADHGGWRGVVGGQFFASKLTIEGEEALLPDNDQTGIGGFVVQEYQTGPFKVELSGRIDHNTVNAPLVGYKRSFTGGSVALGGSIGLGSDARTGINLSRTARAPSANELLILGPHIATQSFEVGDPALGLEKQTGVEGFIRADGARGIANLTLYYSRFSGFVYEAATGGFEDGLPVFEITQGKATHWGAEFEVERDLFTTGAWTFGTDIVADYTHAKIDHVGPAPRIPPLRILGGAEMRSTRLDGRVEVEWADAQTRVSTFETPTESYTVLNAQLIYRPFAERDVAFVLRGENLTDQVVRRHASFLKDFAPLAGRDIRLTLRASF